MNKIIIFFFNLNYPKRSNRSVDQILHIHLWKLYLSLLQLRKIWKFYKINNFTSYIERRWTKYNSIWYKKPWLRIQVNFKPKSSWRVKNPLLDEVTWVCTARKEGAGYTGLGGRSYHAWKVCWWCSWVWPSCWWDSWERLAAGQTISLD